MYIGIDIGGTKCAVTLGEAREGQPPEIKGKHRFDTYHGQNGAEKTLNELCGCVNHFIKESSPLSENIQQEKLLHGIGISCGGPLDSEKGIILSPPNLPEWDRIAVKDVFYSEFGVPVYLQNDANACALAEYRFGAGIGTKNAVFLTFGTGMGAGLILNGSLYSGSCDMAGEVGHIRLASRGSEGYGKKGSFEGFCSGGGIARMARDMVISEIKKGNTPELLTYCGSVENIDAQKVAELAKTGDTLSSAVYTKSAQMLGRGLAVIVDMLNPEVIIIGSIYARSGELLAEECQKVLKNEALPISYERCRVVPSMLGDAIGDYAALSVAMGG